MPRPPDPTGLQMEVLPSLGDLGRAWDRLADRGRPSSPFLRSWWIDGVASAGGGATVLVLRAGGEIVGGAAFELDRVGRGPAAIERVRSLGQGPLAPDHLDVVADPTHGDAVADAVVGWLRRPGHRVVDLDGLAADGRLAGRLVAHAIDRTAAPFAELGDDAEAYLAGRPGQVRSTIRRTAKRLASDGATVVAVDGRDDAAARLALDALHRLHDHRWDDESGFLDDWPRFRRAARAGLLSGDVRITEVRDPEGAVVATEVDLMTDTAVAFYQAGRSTERAWRGAGSVLRAEIVRAAVSDGRHEYDLLRGDESYKSDWATGRRELVRVRFGVGAGRAFAAAASAWRTTAPHVAAARTRLRRRAAS